MCSRVQWKPDGRPVLVGRNMDWTVRRGTKLRAMPRGVERDGAIDENPLRWVARYGSVVASVLDCATVDGLNEAGLNANALYLAEASYGDRAPSEPSDWQSVPQSN